MGFWDSLLKKRERQDVLLNSSSALAYKVGSENSFWNSLICFLCGSFAVMMGVAVAILLLVG